MNNSPRNPHKVPNQYTRSQKSFAERLAEFFFHGEKDKFHDTTREKTDVDLENLRIYDKET